MTPAYCQPVTSRAAAQPFADVSLVAEIMGAPTATVLFVCDAGIDRAAYLDLALTAELRRRGIEEITVLSAGVSAVDGSGLRDQLAYLFGDRGIDVGGFAAHRLRGEHIDEADLILTATSTIRDAVVDLRPRARARVFTVLEAADRVPGIVDLIDVDGPAARVRRLATLLDESRDERPSLDLLGPRWGSHRMPQRRLESMDRTVLELAGAFRPIVRRARHRERTTWRALLARPRTARRSRALQSVRRSVEAA